MELHVTIITTPSNAQFLHTSIPHLRLHTVPFPSHQVGLPDDFESLSSVTDLVSIARVHQGTTLFRGPIEHFEEQHPPDCIVADFLLPWVDDVASKLGIPRLVFNVYSLFAVCAMESVKKSHSNSLTIRGLPQPITLNATPPNMLSRFMEPMMETQLKSHGLIVNKFEELDGEEYLDHYEKSTCHRVWHIGPVSLICGVDRRAQKSVVREEECVNCLNTKRDNLKCIQIFYYL